MDWQRLAEMKKMAGLQRNGGTDKAARQSREQEREMARIDAQVC